jgi:hypothetical protein
LARTDPKDVTHSPATLEEFLVKLTLPIWTALRFCQIMLITFSVDVSISK